MVFVAGSPRSLHDDLRGGRIDFVKILGRKLEVCCANVFLRAGELSRAQGSAR